MPKPFTDFEREAIYGRLIEAGQECWVRYGIKRTNVEDLARLAGISKGTFYLFFKSKELFFMEVLERSHDKIKQRLMEVLMTEQGSPRKRFVSSIMKLYGEIKHHKWLVGLIGGNDEYEYLVRKLPQERIEQHIVGDDEDTKRLLKLFGIAGRVSPETVSAALRALFVMLLHREEIGDEQFDNAFELLLEGVALRLFEGEVE